MRLEAGLLRQVVTLQQFVVSSTDGRGQPVGTWLNQMSMRASVQPVGPKDAEYVNQLYHEASHVVMMRHHAEISRDKRLRFGTRTFHIGFVGDVDEEGHTLRLLCSEVV